MKKSSFLILFAMMTGIAVLCSLGFWQLERLAWKEALIAQIQGAVGKSGDNESYILDTTDHLRELGIRDGLMERISQELTRNGQ